MKVLVAGKVNHNNYGDILMVIFIVSYINENGGEAFILEAGDFLIEQLAEYNLSARNLKIEDVDAEYDICFFTGGGYFAHNLVNGSSWCEKWLKEGYFENIYNQLAKFSIPYYIYSVETGPIDLRAMRDVVYRIFESSNEVVVRNPGSQEFLLRKLNFSKAVVGPDMVLAELGEFYKEYHSSVSVTSDSSSTDKCLGIHVTDKYNRSNYFKRKFVSDLLSAIEENRSKYQTIVLFSDNEETTNLDEAFTYLEKQLSPLYNVEIHRFRSTKTLISCISKVSKVVTTKLHVGVSSLALEKGVICFSDMPKSKRFYESVGLESNFSRFYLTLPFARKNFLARFLEADTDLVLREGAVDFGFYKSKVVFALEKVNETR